MRYQQQTSRGAAGVIVYDVHYNIMQCDAAPALPLTEFDKSWHLPRRSATTLVPWTVNDLSQTSSYSVLQGHHADFSETKDGPT